MPQRIAFHQNKSSNKDFRQHLSSVQWTNSRTYKRIKRKEKQETCLQSALASPEVKRHRYEHFLAFLCLKYMRLIVLLLKWCNIFCRTSCNKVWIRDDQCSASPPAGSRKIKISFICLHNQSQRDEMSSAFCFYPVFVFSLCLRAAKPTLRSISRSLCHSFWTCFKSPVVFEGSLSWRTFRLQNVGGVFSTVPEIKFHSIMWLHSPGLSSRQTLGLYFIWQFKPNIYNNALAVTSNTKFCSDLPHATSTGNPFTFQMKLLIVKKKKSFL